MTSPVPTPAPSEVLRLIEALIAADPNPPGLKGRLALGSYEEGQVEWLLLEFDGKQLSSTRSMERNGARGFDCVGLLPPGTQVDRLAEAAPYFMVDGQTELLGKVAARYFQTTSHLGFQLQRATAARGPSSARKRSRS